MCKNRNNVIEKISIGHEFDFFRKVNLFLTSWETNCRKVYFDPKPKMGITRPKSAKKQFIISNWLIINKFCLKRITIHELLWWLWFEVTFLRFWKIAKEKKIVIPKLEDFELIRKRDISKWFKILSNVLEHLELILEHNLHHFQTCLKMAQEGQQRSSMVI